MKSIYRKPLVVFTPKSLLRHPKAVSTIEEFTDGSFLPVIDDVHADPEKIKSLVFCTGKFYYDLLEAREKDGRDDVALVRIEQLFPVPSDELRKLVAKYEYAEDLVWAQEEPRNMGAWGHFLMYFEEVRNFRVASRRYYAAPAAGSAVRSQRRHQEVIDYVFDKEKDNFIRRIPAKTK